MREHPGVFLPVHWVPGGYWMQRRETLDDPVQLFGGLALLEVLWREEVPRPPEWKDRYAQFLLNCAYSLHLTNMNIYRMQKVLEHLPNEPWVTNHGDATLSNLVREWPYYFWIDPAQRTSSPRTKSVDVARMWQTTHLRYEEVLRGNYDAAPMPEVGRDLAQAAGVDEGVVKMHLVLLTLRLTRHLSGAGRSHFFMHFLKLLEKQLCEWS